MASVPRACARNAPAEPLLESLASRSAAVLLAGSLLLGAPGPALAADGDAGGNPLRSLLRGPAEFYRGRQQANGGGLLLGPLRVSQARLEAAAAALDAADVPAALTAVRAASMDCIVFDADAADTKQELTTAGSSSKEYKMGDPCKLRLVVKNATTLTRDAALVADADAQMQAILRQLSLLENRLDSLAGGDGDSGGGGAAKSLLGEALASNAEFQGTIKRCLGLE